MRRVWRWTWRIALGLLLLAVTAWAIALVVTGRRLEAELARLKGSGAPLTLAEAAPQEVPSNQNAAALYEQAFMGLPYGRDAEQIENFISHDEEKREGVSVKAIESIVRQYDTTLTLLKEASARPACRFPVDWEAGGEAVLPHYSRLGAAARLLAAKALLSAQRDDSTEPFEVIALLLRMSDHIAAEPTLVSELVRMTCQAIAVETLNHVMETAPPSTSDCHRMFGTLREIDNMGPFTNAMKGERALGLWEFSLLRRDPGQLWHLHGVTQYGWVQRHARFVMSLWLPLFQQDEVFYIRYMNRLVELSRRLSNEPNGEYVALERDLRDLPKYVILTRLLVPVVSHARLERRTAMARVGLAEHGLALRAHQEATGHYPSSLAELRHKVDWPLPEDPFSGRDFVYRQAGDGYLIYSIGLNMKDEGGKDRPSPRGPLPPRRRPPDDIAWAMSG